MFLARDDKFIVEIEIAGKVVLREKYTTPKFERDRQMLIRKAERDSRGRPWAIFVIKQRQERTRRSHRKIPKDATYFI
jgi:hypothetical protein